MTGDETGSDSLGRRVGELIGPNVARLQPMPVPMVSIRYISLVERIKAIGVQDPLSLSKSLTARALPMPVPDPFAEVRKSLAVGVGVGVGVGVKTTPLPDWFAKMRKSLVAPAVRVPVSDHFAELRKSLAPRELQVPVSDSFAGLRAQLSTTSVRAGLIGPAIGESISVRIARQVAYEITHPVDLARRPRLVDGDYFAELLREASAQTQVDAALPLLPETARHASATAVPLGDDRLLTDDTAAVELWAASLLDAFLVRTGLSERDLLEDAVAYLAYAATMSLAVALLVQFPMLLYIAGIAGVGGANPAKAMSQLARHGYRTMNDL